jgi:hypothetical protein
MKATFKSPSYLVRNPYSYCFRMVVPKDLRKFVGKTELRYTLRTGKQAFELLIDDLKAENTND